MDREFTGLNVLANTGGSDQFLGESCRLAFGDHPTDRVAAEDIQDIVEIVIGPFGRSQEFRNIPAPQLVRLGSQQLRFGVIRVAQLVTAFPHFLIFIQNAIHRPPGAQIFAFVQQRGIDFARRLIGKALTVKHLPDFCFLYRRKRTRGDNRGRGCNRFGDFACPVETTSGHNQRLASGRYAHAFCQLLSRGDQLGSSRSGVSNVFPNICATFFWKSIMNSARSRRSCKRAFSRRNLASSIACGLRSGTFLDMLRLFGERARVSGNAA
jgi:hypothetical protein